MGHHEAMDVSQAPAPRLDPVPPSPAALVSDNKQHRQRREILASPSWSSSESFVALAYTNLKLRVGSRAQTAAYYQLRIPQPNPHPPTMASRAAVPFLVAMMLLTGVCNTLLTKFQVRMRQPRTRLVCHVDSFADAPVPG